VGGTWGIRSSFDPALAMTVAMTAGGDAVPTGESTWQYYDGTEWAYRALTVTELSDTEAAAEAKKAQATKEAVRPRALCTRQRGRRSQHHPVSFFVCTARRLSTVAAPCTRTWPRPSSHAVAHVAGPGAGV
jgi:hypothetical protein